MSVVINNEDFAKPWRPGVYPKSTTVIYDNQLWILNDTITGLFSSSDFLAEVANGDWIGRYTTEGDLSTKEDKTNKAIDFSVINNTLYPTVEAVEDRIALIPTGGSQIQITHTPNNSLSLTTDQWTSFDYRGLSSVTLIASFGTGSTPNVTLNFGNSFSIIPPIDKKLKGLHVMIQDGGYDLEIGICKSDVGLSGGSRTNLNRRFIQKFLIPSTSSSRTPHYFEITDDDANGVDGSQYFPMIKKNTGVSQALRFVIIYVIE